MCNSYANVKGRLRLAKTTLKKKNEVGDYLLTDFKIYYKAPANKMFRQGNRVQLRNRQNR